MSKENIKLKFLYDKKLRSVYKTQTGKLYIKIKNKDNKLIKKYLTSKQLGGFSTGMLEKLRNDLNIFNLRKTTLSHGVMTRYDSSLLQFEKPDFHYIEFNNTEKLFNDLYQYTDAHKKIIIFYRISVINNAQVLEIEFTGKHEKLSISA